MTNNHNDAEVLVPNTQEVRVYLNDDNDVVIKRGLVDFEFFNSDQDRDVHILILKNFVPALIEKLKTLLVQVN